MRKTKRIQLLQTARALFFRYGFRRITVEEICETANVSKMTFYRYFDNKTDLLKGVVSRLFDEGEREYRQIMDQELPFEDKVQQTLDMKLEKSQDASQEFFNEYMVDPDPEIARLIQDRQQRMLQMVIKDYQLAQQNGDIRSDIQPQFILYMLNQLIEMTKDKGLRQLYATPSELIMEVTRFFFYGILPHEKKS
ncbi:TetR family transcriptional regulator [candidate division KSB1 bacterium]|nr:TetR family transcriptional regulator [candidate division KSB1 bacterium]